MHAPPLLPIKRFSITRSLLFICAFLTASIFVIRHTFKPTTNPLYDFEHIQFNRSKSWNPAQVRRNLRLLTPQHLPPAPSPAPHDVCLLLSPDPDAKLLWRMNSRSVCVTSPLCIPTDPNSDTKFLHTSTFTDTTCRAVTPQFGALPHPMDNPQRLDPTFPSCSYVQSHFQLCPVQNGTGRFQVPCIPSRPNSEKGFRSATERAEHQRTMLEGITLIVPRYAYAGNIYHYAASMSMIGHVASNLETILQHYGFDRIEPPNALTELPLNILFYSTAHLPWQSGFIKALLQGRVSKVSPRGVRIYNLEDMQDMGPRVCVRNPVSLSRRGHVNAWPFVNSSVLAIDGSEVPVDAVGMRMDIYKYVGIMPPPMLDSVRFESIGRIPVPPLVVGYSRRAGRESVVGNGVHAAGTVRRFSDEDEQWFGGMLQNETATAGVRLTTFVTTANDTFQEQVKRMVDIGFIVGIHGANLANSLFMRPFGAILEIFPADMLSACYVGGSNSGLAYFPHHALVRASAKESGCTKEERRCQQLTRQRMVKIGTDEDRAAVRSKVQLGIQHIIKLNSLYGDSGIPVEHDPIKGVYRIKK